MEGKGEKSHKIGLGSKSKKSIYSPPTSLTLAQEVYKKKEKVEPKKEKVITRPKARKRPDLIQVATEQQSTSPSLFQQLAEAQKNFNVNPAELSQAQTAIEIKYNYNAQGEIEVTKEEFQTGLSLNDDSKLSFQEVTDDSIEVDDKEIDGMLQAAKIGDFHRVWPTLKKKPYLVNCIPEHRAWAMLHQAIFQDNLDAVVTLVDDFGADVTVRTKNDRANAAQPGTDALSLAVQFGRDDIYQYMIMKMLLSTTVTKSRDISYYVLHKNGTIYPFHKNHLFQITLASYKSMFLADKKHNIDQSKNLIHAVSDVYSNSDSTWEDAKIKIRNTLYGLDRGHSEYLVSASSKDEFFGRLIKLFTEDSVFHYLTPALIRQSNSPYTPLATDLAIGPFALMLGTVLMHWNQLEPFDGKTYRGVCIDVTDKYIPGETILFLYFIASSKQKAVAEAFGHAEEGTLFIFDNSCSTRWQPRCIKQFSRIPDEEECLYPLGAEFKVKSVDKESRIVQLKLLDPAY